MERALQIAAKAIEAEKQIFALTEENEALEIALNTSLQFLQWPNITRFSIWAGTFLNASLLASVYQHIAAPTLLK